MSTLIKLTLPLLFAISVTGCGSSDNQSKSSSQNGPLVSVVTAPVQRTSIPIRMIIDGRTDVINRESVTSPIDGTVLSVQAAIGTIVSPGDTLATIRSRSSEASIDGARRMLETATTPESVNESRAALDLALSTQQLVVITAETAGQVTERYVSGGQRVSTDAPLMQLVDMSSLDFIANLPLDSLDRVAPGQECTVTFPSRHGQTYKGTVVTVNPVSDPATQTVPVQINLKLTDIASAPRVGTMGTALITTGVRTDVLAVPASALLRDDLNNTYSLYGVGPDSLAHIIAVEVGVQSDSLAEISAPSLQVGDPIIVKGNYEVSDSTRVSVKSDGVR